MFGYNQQNGFLKDVVTSSIPASVLDDAVEWIGRHLNPEDVFSEADLKDWAVRIGLIDE